MRIAANIRKKLNGFLFDMGHNKYYPSIPIDEIIERFKGENILLLQEDGTEWEGIFCGKEGRATIRIGNSDLTLIDNSMLCLQWYKMESGRYEINAYLS